MKIQFPRVETADENGILALSDEVDTDFLIAAYSRGIFPWPVEEKHILWFAPPERAVLDFKDFRLSKRTIRYLRNSGFEFNVNRDFDSVIEKCAKMPRKGQGGTWITDKILKAYKEFHHAGYAVSFEARGKAGNLAGGMYGVSVGRYFAGESMFHKESNASKFVLHKAITFLSSKGLTWMDVQVMNPFLESVGCKNITRREFTKRLSKALRA